MTAFTHQTLQEHVRVHQAQVTADVHASLQSNGLLRKMRRSVAEGLVRTGAWLLPDKPGMVGTTVLVLPRQNKEGPRQIAA
ncbi:MAG: hypothetical protein ABFR95_10540 [Actinomycetota bacterium]